MTLQTLTLLTLAIHHLQSVYIDILFLLSVEEQYLNNRNTNKHEIYMPHTQIKKNINKYTKNTAVRDWKLVASCGQSLLRICNVSPITAQCTYMYFGTSYITIACAAKSATAKGQEEERSIYRLSDRTYA